jgi:hypothetical protein
MKEDLTLRKNMPTATQHSASMGLWPWILLCFVLGQVVIGICALDDRIGAVWGFFSVMIGSLSYFTPAGSLGWAINCLALYEKYATEGVRLQGTVLKTWDVEITDGGGRAYYVEVLYQVGDLFYKSELSWAGDGYLPHGQSILAGQEAEPPTLQPKREGPFGCLPMPVISSSSMVDLVYLPGYPQSAMFHVSVKDAKSRLHHPDVARNRLPFAIFLTACVNFSSCAITPLFSWDWIGAVPYIWLSTALTIPMVAVSFMHSYWDMICLRETTFHACLYGAKQQPGGAAQSLLTSVGEEQHKVFAIQPSLKGRCSALQNKWK